MIRWLARPRCYLTNPSAIVLLVSGEPMIDRASLDQQVTVAVWKTEHARARRNLLQIDKV